MMMDRETLRKIIAESLSFTLPETLERDMHIDLAVDKVIVLAGIRRSGKTYELYNIIKKLLLLNIPRNRILYVNFEDERFMNSTHEDLDKIIDIYREISGVDVGTKVHLFLDEVQNIEGWDKWVRRMYESENYKIFVTGSSSKLLSSEIATSLAGRNITYIIYPFSFKEFLSFKKIPVDRLSVYSNKGNYNKLLDEYLINGGFPEVAKTENPDSKIRILSSYYDAIIFRDLIQRFRIRNVNLLSSVLKFSLVSYSGNFSASKLFNYLNSTGVKVSKRTVNNFITYGKSVFLFDEIYAWSRSLRKANQSRKKIYLTDPGFSLLFKRSDDMGRLLENAVMIQLLRTKVSENMMEINYMEIGGKEVDFVISRFGEIVEGINVTMELTQSNREREIRSLVEFMKKFKVKNGKIITFDTNDEVVVDGQKIEIMSFINWGLGI